jgi:DNA-binding response OmpR family regulator
MARCVLVVDDEPGIRELLRFFLEAGGFEVRTASNGTEGLAAYREDAPPIVLLDGSMPDMTGYEVARGIRAAQLGEPTIVMLSGEGAALPTPEVLREHGIDHYMSKPFDDQELLGLLERLG